jgi:hypothetical protein
MTLHEWLHRLWGTLRRSRTDRDLEDELRIHLELVADEERRRGASEESAARTAKLRVGSVAQATEAQRDQRGLLWLEDLVRDLRYAGRMLAKSPSFTVVSVVSLAIGIGANCAVFSFADTLLLRPLAVPRADGLLTVGLMGSFRDSLIASYREYVDIRDQSQSGALYCMRECCGVADEPSADARSGNRAAAGDRSGSSPSDPAAPHGECVGRNHRRGCRSWTRLRRGGIVQPDPDPDGSADRSLVWTRSTRRARQSDCRTSKCSVIRADAGDSVDSNGFDRRDEGD